MPDNLQAKPILDFALLPVNSGQFGGERWKLGMFGMHGCPHKQIARIALRFEYVIVEEDTFRGTAVLGKDRNQPGLELISQAIDQSPNVGVANKNINLLLAFRRDRLNLRAESFLENLKQFTKLERKGEPIYLSRMAATSDGYPSIGGTLFYFERGNSVLADDKQVTFVTRVGPYEVKARFNLKEMLYHGKLEL